MRVSEACEIYLNGFCEISFSPICSLTNLIAVGKIFSYATVILPIRAGIAYLASTQYEAWVSRMREEALPGLAVRESYLKNQIGYAPDKNKPQYVPKLCSLATDYCQKAGVISEFLILKAKKCNGFAETNIERITNLLIIAHAEDQLKLESKKSTTNLILELLEKIEPGKEKTNFCKEVSKLCTRLQIAFFQMRKNKEPTGTLSPPKSAEDNLLSRMLGFMQEKFA